jgi:type VI secretion system lysozyme-like protein
MEPGHELGELTNQLRPVHGRRALLFDRLEAGESSTSSEPYRVDEWSALRQSVAYEIQNLLNTRLPPGQWEAISEPQTVIDYGIPDFSSLSAASDTDRRTMCEVIARKITAFEPRLSQVRLQLQPDPVNQVSLLGSVEANLIMQSLVQPVSFPLSISTEGEIVLL